MNSVEDMYFLTTESRDSRKEELNTMSTQSVQATTSGLANLGQAFYYNAETGSLALYTGTFEFLPGSRFPATKAHTPICNQAFVSLSYSSTIFSKFHKVEAM